MPLLPLRARVAATASNMASITNASS